MVSRGEVLEQLASPDKFVVPSPPPSVIESEGPWVWGRWVSL